ncbi:MAG: alpha-amylase, partial [Cyclobacteriaceae bacterium]|nr:alpha-amylase [Cyclobacteriaceae bacterium HetDA_MAG_MS6]
MAKTQDKRPIIYQVMTRLFGNQQSKNVPWGTIEENGVGKFNDFDSVALQAIKSLGITHVWYTGAIE